MFHDLQARELRFLGSGVMFIGALAWGSWLLLQGPWAPGALSKADAHLAAGDHVAAVTAYLEVSESAWSEDDRADALWRAAQVAHADEQVDTALRLLERFVAEHPTHDKVASAHDARAELFATVADRPDDAARAWSEAARHSADLDEAGMRWLAAGRAWQDAGNERAARKAYRAATASPASQARAWLAMGHLELALDPAAAYDAYDRALLARPDGPDAGLARLGMATAMERLDGAEAALADLEQVSGQEDDALSRRRARLQGEGESGE